MHLGQKDGYRQTDSLHQLGVKNEDTNVWANT